METPTLDIQQLLQENAKLQKDVHDITQQRDALEAQVEELDQENEMLRKEVLLFHGASETTKTDLLRVTQEKARLEIRDSKSTLELQTLEKEVHKLREDRKVLDTFAKTLNAHNKAQRDGNIGNMSNSTVQLMRARNGLLNFEFVVQ